MENNPAVTVVYSWDDDEHKNWVKDLVNELESNQVNVSFDGNSLELGADLNQFMEMMVSSASIILAVCSEKYKEKIDNRDGGSGYEGRLIAEKIKDKSVTVIPVLKTDYSKKIIPEAFTSLNCVNLSNGFESEDFGKLLAKIMGLEVKKTTALKEPKETIARILNIDVSEVMDSKQFELVDIKIMNIVANEITSPKMDGTAGSALYKIPFRLSSRPERRWKEFFIKHWNNPSKCTLMHRPKIASVSGNYIWLNGTTIEEVKQYHKATLELAIKCANEDYNKENEKIERTKLESEKKEIEFKNKLNETIKDINF